LKIKNIIGQKTKIFASHISHEENLPHDEFLIFAEKYGYNVAFDGLVISKKNHMIVSHKNPTIACT